MIFCLVQLDDFSLICRMISLPDYVQAQLSVNTVCAFQLDMQLCYPTSSLTDMTALTL